ncbi:MAG: TolC family protein [Alkalispirochaetaceae bacterium]
MIRSLLFGLLVSGALVVGTGAGFAQDGGPGSGVESTGSGIGGITGSESRTHGPLALTPTEAVELALTESGALRNARIDLSLARKSDDNSWNRFLPDLDLSGGSSYSLAEEARNRLSLSSQLSARLTLSGAALSDGERREQAVRVSSLALEREEWDLRREVLLSYFSLVSQEASVELQEQRVAAARSRLEQTRTRFENGVVSEYAFLEARLSYQNSLPELTGAEQRLSRAQREFKELLGVRESREIELVTEIPYLSLEPGASTLLDRHGAGAPSVRAAQLSRSGAMLEARGDRRALLPSLSASASVGYGADEPFEQWRRTGSASLSLSLPIDPFVPGSEGDVAREESARAVDQADSRLETARKELATSLRNAVDGARLTAEQIAVVEENARLAERVYEIAQRRFEAGAIEALELQNTEVERTRARVAVIEQRLAHVEALIEVEYLLGVVLPDLPW